MQTPVMIHFGEEPGTRCSSPHEAAAAGVEIENTGSEPLVGLRYFGPMRTRTCPKSATHDRTFRIVIFNHCDTKRTKFECVCNFLCVRSAVVVKSLFAAASNKNWILW